MDKKEVIEYIKNDIYCRLKPSKIHGIGVFAIKDIPHGTELFLGSSTAVSVKLSKDDLKDVTEEVMEFIKQWWVHSNKSFYINFNPHLFDHFVYYLNSSSEFNVEYDEFYNVYTTRDITKGEELFRKYFKGLLKHE